jgi:hypothetical protein
VPITVLIHFCPAFTWRNNKLSLALTFVNSVSSVIPPMALVFSGDRRAAIVVALVTRSVAETNVVLRWQGELVAVGIAPTLSARAPRNSIGQHVSANAPFLVHQGNHRTRIVRACVRTEQRSATACVVQAGKSAPSVTVFVVRVSHAKEEKPAAMVPVSKRKITALTVVNAVINVQPGKPANPVSVDAVPVPHAQAGRPAATGCALL